MLERGVIWDAVVSDCLPVCGVLRLTLSLPHKWYSRTVPSSLLAIAKTRIYSSYVRNLDRCARFTITKPYFIRLFEVPPLPLASSRQSPSRHNPHRLLTSSSDTCLTHRTRSRRSLPINPLVLKALPLSWVCPSTLALGISPSRVSTTVLKPNLTLS